MSFNMHKILLVCTVLFIDFTRDPHKKNSSTTLRLTIISDCPANLSFQEGSVPEIPYFRERGVNVLSTRSHHMQMRSVPVCHAIFDSDCRELTHLYITIYNLKPSNKAYYTGKDRC